MERCICSIPVIRLIGTEPLQQVTTMRNDKLVNILQQRSSGILLPVFSLPGSWGIGDLGDAARAFIDFLGRAGQSAWQILPLGPTSA